MLDKLHKCSWTIQITNAIQARIVGNITRGLTQAQKIKKEKEKGTQLCLSSSGVRALLSFYHRLFLGGR